MSLFRVSVIATFAFLPSALASIYGHSNLNHTCLLVPEYQSCTVNANPLTVDSCCVETYGGLVLATQFWSTYTGLESSGQVLPKNSWTLHGLWPDFCNGSYTQYCDLTRQYDPFPSPNKTTGPNGTLFTVPAYSGPTIDNIIKAFGRLDLLSYMSKYWINQNAPSTEFWAHEFSKHGTCYSTFDTECYGPAYVKNQDVIDYFETSVKFFRQLPTYDWLAGAGIVPSNRTAYSLRHIQSALRVRFGATPYLGCTGVRYNDTAAANSRNETDRGRTVLSEVWYYHNVLGRAQNSRSVAVDASTAGSVSSCSNVTDAIWYYERSKGSEV